MGRCSMPLRCSEALAGGAACLLIMAAVPALTHAEQACATRLPCTEDAFLERLLKVANETRLSALPGVLDQAFGVELTLHTRVFVSALLETSEPFGVQRFVRLGDTWYPLNFGTPGACVTLAPMDRVLQADGWQGGRTAGARGTSEVWVYRKGRTQLLVEPMELKDSSGGGRTCAGSILLTYRQGAS
jgi:hypothetical protein